ncbi:hypothetical protein HS088_TW02G00466 [Tripterygium wilfordii]|uniref:RING-type E3 ubiquitin transferase n=1 Tax=Tripterygium wilfordii TaxID=458696 RepID=A0A7J7DYI0_TRIWF|nr:RING-H2 finger protein ATL52-like [Tripterygium wilfordii]KAF5751452.1 hypothetical protein HS088_TW02G00466 [Tripterygium wilfordii]
MDSPQSPDPTHNEKNVLGLVVAVLSVLLIVGYFTYEYVSHHCHRVAQQDHDIESGAGTADAAITTTAAAAEPPPLTIVYEQMKIQEGMEVCVACSICMEDYKDGEECGVIAVCNHKYHKQCIDKWLRRKKECPVCRRPVTVRRGKSN